MKIILPTFILMLLSACSQTPTQNYLSVLDHYKWCDSNLTDVSEVITCGGQKRERYCMENNICSSEGNANVAYFNYLAERRESDEISPAELRWLFTKKIQEIEEEGQRQARRRQAEIAKANDDLIRAGLDMMNSSGGGYGSQSQTTGYLSHQEASGYNRICYYESTQGKKALNLKSTEICPTNYVF